MDFEKENSMNSENNSPEPVKEDIFSSEQGGSYESMGYTDREARTESNSADDMAANSTAGGEYRIPNPIQDRDFEAQPEAGGRNADYNPYQASSPAGTDYTTGYSYGGANNGGNSSYSGYGTTGSTNPSPAKKPTGSGKGKKIIAVLLAVFLILGSVGIGIAIGRSSGNSGGTDATDTSSTTADNAEITLGTTQAAQQVNNSPGTVVAEAARNSVVGVVTYDSRGALNGEGSGVVMGTNDAGSLTYIITCAHVVSAKSIASCGVLLEDGTVYDAKIVGYDERTDLGVLSIKETGLKAATFGDSSALKVGEAVYAIGNPGGSEFYGSVTDGIVSALDRSITSTYTMQVIQHTAAISPGNSGGALVNSAGQVIGINSSKIVATDYEGIGFAIPMKTAKPVVESIIAYGYVPNRPKLGISYASVSNYQAYSMVVQIKGLPAGSVIIAEISDDSSLKDTKVEVGDMITAVNGKDMTSSDVLLDIIDSAKVGDKLKLEICRIDSKTYKITTFEVTAEIVEDKGSSVKKDEETTTESYYDYYGGENGGNFGGFGDFDDFFSQFFGGGF